MKRKRKEKREEEEEGVKEYVEGEKKKSGEMLAVIAVEPNTYDCPGCIPMDTPGVLLAMDSGDLCIAHS